MSYFAHITIGVVLYLLLFRSNLVVYGAKLLSLVGFKQFRGVKNLYDMTDTLEEAEGLDGIFWRLLHGLLTCAVCKATVCGLLSVCLAPYMPEELALLSLVVVCVYTSILVDERIE